MIDLKNFTEKESKGLVTLTRITEDALAFSTKKFDPTTGEELPEEVIGGNLKKYKDKVIELQGQIDEISAFITKIEAMEIKN